jgi:hypothetical protein
MNAIQRRLRRLEDQIKPGVNERGETAADVIRERRRRRLEEAGLPYEDRPPEIFAGARSNGEIVRLSRLWLRERGAPYGGRTSTFDR